MTSDRLHLVQNMGYSSKSSIRSPGVSGKMPHQASQPSEDWNKITMIQFTEHWKLYNDQKRKKKSFKKQKTKKKYKGLIDESHQWIQSSLTKIIVTSPRIQYVLHAKSIYSYEWYLAPAIKPAGRNFLDPQNLFPIMPVRAPDVAGR